MFRNPSSIALSKELIPSLVSFDICISSSSDIMVSHMCVKFKSISLGFNKFGLKMLFLPLAIKYDSAMLSTHVSISSVSLSNTFVLVLLVFTFCI